MSCVDVSTPLSWKNDLVMMGKAICLQALPILTRQLSLWIEIRCDLTLGVELKM